MKFENNPDSGYDNTETLLVVVPMKDLHIEPLEIAQTRYQAQYYYYEVQGVPEVMQVLEVDYDPVGDAGNSIE